MAELKDYIELIDNFILNTRESILYLAVNQTLMNIIPDCFNESYRIMDLRRDMSPMKPFSTLVKEMDLPDSAVEDELYSLQKDAFVSFLKDGLCRERADVIFEQEFLYERNMMQDSMARLVSKYGTKNYIFMNAQYIFEEGFETIKKLEKMSLDSRLIFCFDSVNSELVSDGVRTFLEHISNRRNFLHIIVNEDAEDLSDRRNYLNPQTYRHSATFSEIKDFHLIWKSLRNYRLTLSYDQASSFCTWLASSLQNFTFTHAQKRKLYQQMAQVQYEAGNPDEAVLYLNNIIDYQNDDELETWAYYYMARVFSKKKSNSVAQKYAVLTQKKLLSKKDDPLYALSMMIEYYVMNRVKSANLVQKYMESLDALEKCRLYNNYVATAVKIPWELVERQERHGEVFSIFDKCFKYSRQMGNRHLYSSVLHWKGIVLSHSGRRDEAFEHFNETNRLRTEIGEIQPLLAIRNGLSYESLNRGLYLKAYNTVNEVVEKLYQVKDFSTIVDTLKSLSYGIFFTRHFDLADRFFAIISHFLNMFKLTNSANNSFLPSMNDILIYRSLIDLHNGDYIHAKMNYLTMSQNNLNVASVDRPLLRLIKAIILVQEGKVSEAHAEFDLGVREFVEKDENQEHKIVFMYFEYAKHLSRTGRDVDSRRYLDVGFSLARRHRFTYYTKNKTSVSVSDYLNGAEKIEPVKINVQFLFEKAEKDKILNVLHGRIHEYQFLNKIRSYNSDSTGVKKYLEKVCSAVLEYTMAQGVFVAECQMGVWKKLYSQGSAGGASGEDFLDEKSFLAVLNGAKGTEVCQIFYDSSSEVYYSNISKYDFEGGIIIVPERLGLFDSEILETLGIALTNIQAQLVMVRQNEHLLFVSSTDQLSLLKNRHSLQEHLTMESERIDRFLMRKKVLIHCTIGFIDLNNFKYYNDTFGHNAGDLMIRCFSNLLKQTLRKIDFIARYGGDEFVIVMSDTSLVEGKRVYGRLFEGLKREKFFVPHLRDFLKNDELEIPEEKLINFSMGLCSNLDMEDPADLVSVMDCADKALYYAKENNKGSLAVWCDVKDFI